MNWVVPKVLVFDQGKGEFDRSMQLFAGGTGQECNHRKQCLGSFWQDRYHATAVESDSHLQQCITYIDLNMVRAGVVEHPAKWAYGGYAEIQSPRERYGRIDYARLQELLRLRSTDELQRSRKIAMAEALKECRLQRNPIWTESVAVGSEQYLEHVKDKLKIRQLGRRLLEVGGETCLREPTFPLYRILKA